ncbi:MAG: HDOD domain-containing protein [Acidovorax sp.]|nr:HDOD domain-containing protein [Acidovorax sp.]
MTSIPTLLTLDREALARDIRALPSLPTVVQELLLLVRQKEVQLEAISNTLRLDQALSIKVLQLANSPFYGLSGRIGSVRDAINILGLRQLGSLVIAAALTVQFEKLHGKSLHMDSFWRHSIGCAAAARQLAVHVGLDSAAAFTAGLLHDVGRLVVDSHYPLEAAEAIAWAEEHDMPHSEAEHTLLGIDHTELGEWVCRHWRFSSDVVEAIAGHHRPPPAGPVSLIDVVHVADAITHALDIAGAATEAVPGVNPMAWARLNLHEDDLPALLASIESEFNDLLAVLRPAKETP